MTCCNYDSSSDSDSDNSTASCLSDGNLRYPIHISSYTSHSRTYATSLSCKKRTWSETDTDDESDLPGVPNYSSARFLCYASDEAAEFENSRENKRKRANNGKPVLAPVAGGVIRDLIKCPVPAPRPTTASRPRVRQPSAASRFINNDSLRNEDVEYLTFHNLPSIEVGEGQLECVPVANRPPHIRPFVHVYPAPKPTTAVTVPLRLRKAAASPVEPKVVTVPKWIGVTSTWSFPSS